MAFWMCSSVWRSIPPPRPERDREILRSDTFLRAVSSCPAATSLSINQSTRDRTNNPETTRKHAPTDSPETRKHAPRLTALRINSTAPKPLPQNYQNYARRILHVVRVVEILRHRKNGPLLRDAPETIGSPDVLGTKASACPKLPRTYEGRDKGN